MDAKHSPGERKECVRRLRGFERATGEPVAGLRLRPARGAGRPAAPAGAAGGVRGDAAGAGAAGRGREP
ncbi:hypothetical protein [Streptomyces griseoaurantiacus]|uniref:hypothetical protein n=1 Tax=Streptomyces griseoaurantiacus TaxID=68213 RepID=UPI00345FA67C